MKTTKNPANDSHTPAPLRLNKTRTTSPIPNEAKNTTTAQSALGQRLALQCGQTTVESPERVHSDFAGTCWWHCGQSMVRYLPTAGVPDGTCWGLPPLPNRRLIYHKSSPPPLWAAIYEPRASKYLDWGRWQFGSELKSMLRSAYFLCRNSDARGRCPSTALIIELFPQTMIRAIPLQASARITGAL